MINIIVSGVGEYLKPCYIRLRVTDPKTAPAPGSSRSGVFGKEVATGE